MYVYLDISVIMKRKDYADSSISQQQGPRPELRLKACPVSQDAGALLDLVYKYVPSSSLVSHFVLYTGSYYYMVCVSFSSSAD